MIHVFFDTEFTDLIVDRKLISIGLIDETGEQTFYAELCDTWRLADVGDFAREAVLPLLDGGTSLLTIRELGEHLTAGIMAFGAPVKLATDSLAWDWPWILELFHEPHAWPENLDGKPLLLNETDQFSHAVEQAFAEGLRRHHALDDAKANRLGWLAAGGDTSRAAP